MLVLVDLFLKQDHTNQHQSQLQKSLNYQVEKLSPVEH